MQEHHRPAPARILCVLGLPTWPGTAAGNSDRFAAALGEPSTAISTAEIEHGALRTAMGTGAAKEVTKAKICCGHQAAGVMNLCAYTVTGGTGLGKSPFKWRHQSTCIPRMLEHALVLPIKPKLALFSVISQPSSDRVSKSCSSEVYKPRTLLSGGR